jgi:hypothetical protein
VPDTNHATKDCPMPKQVYCRGCGSAGHTLRDCLTPSTPMNYDAGASGS